MGYIILAQLFKSLSLSLKLSKGEHRILIQGGGDQKRGCREWRGGEKNWIQSEIGAFMHHSFCRLNLLFHPLEEGGPRDSPPKNDSGGMSSPPPPRLSVHALETVSEVLWDILTKYFICQQVPLITLKIPNTKRYPTLIPMRKDIVACIYVLISYSQSFNELYASETTSAQKIV